MLWELYQQYQIDQLDQKINRVDHDVATSAATVHVAAQLDDKLNRWRSYAERCSS